MSSFRNLSVPYFSQRENKYVWQEKEPAKIKDKDTNEIIPNPNAGKVKPNGKSHSLAATSCNITCLTMILQYLGLTTETPDDILKNLYEPAEEGEHVSEEIQALREQTYSTYDRIEYLDFLANIVKAFYPDAKVVTSHLKKGFDYVEQHVANGIPVMISCGIVRRYTESYYSEGVSKWTNDISIIKSNYKKENGSDYDADLSEAQENLEKATEEEKPEAQQKLEEIQARYDQEEQKRLAWYLEYYRHRGHYIVVRGFTEDSVIINDPWGSPLNLSGEMNNDGNGNYGVSPFGDNIKIPRDQFELQYNDDTNLWATIAVYHCRWGFILNNNSIPRRVKPTEDMLENCYEQETFQFGGFPMKRTNLWHNGVHLQTSEKEMIYPMGPGQIVAARILNRNEADSASDPEALNGSRCFVLVKHQILIGDTLKDFYSLYMHLEPQSDFAEVKQKYPEKTTGISWLDSLLFRSNKFFRMLWDKEAVIYRVSDNEPIGKLYSSQIIAYDRTEEGKFYYQHDDVPCYSYQRENDIWKFVTYGNYETNDSESIEKYGTVIQSLIEGKITYFKDLPDPYIEVTNSTSIGKSGTFGGSEGSDEQTIHWEVFSNENFVESYPGHEIHLIDYAKTQNLGICNRRDMVEMFHNEEVFDSFFDRAINLREDGIISKREMTSFYNSPHSNILRYYICQHKSEWAEDIDWETEIENSVGIIKDQPWSIWKNSRAKGVFNTLSDYVQYVYDPYKWLNHEMVANMGAIEDNQLKEGKATFYHPITLLHWLYENDEVMLTRLQNT